MNSRIALVLTTQDGKLYLLRSNDCKAMRIKESGKYTFQFKDMTDLIDLNDDLTEYLKL
jgi:hypothetical protein